MTVNAITDTKKGEQGLRLLIYMCPKAHSPKYEHIIHVVSGSSLAEILRFDAIYCIACKL